MRAASQLAIFCKSFAEKPKNKCYIPNFIVVVYPTLLFATIALKDLCFITYLRFHLAQTIPKFEISGLANCCIASMTLGKVPFTRLHSTALWDSVM